MVWFKIRVLEDKIKNNKFSDRECLTYLFWHVAFYALSFSAVSHNPNFYNKGLVFSRVIGIGLINILGLLLTFNTYQKANGTYYFKNLIAISFVVGIRVAIVFASALVFILLLSMIVFGNDKVKTFQNSLVNSWIILLSAQIMQITIYLLINNSFKRITNNRD